MLELFEARFESGDLYPGGSSFRSDALGTRALYDAIAEALPKTVSRHRGRSGQLSNASDATIIVTQLSLSRLIIKQDRLVRELTEAAQHGARVVVTLDDRQTQSCRMTYCNEDKKTRCHGIVPNENPGDTSTQAKEQSCNDAALGLWGFEIGGTLSKRSNAVELTKSVVPRLPQRLPWHNPAKFIELVPEFRTVYARGDDAVVIERSLGKGSLVLLTEGYLLTNEAQREARFTDFVVWLIGQKTRVIFEESHLGVTEPRGIMTLVRELRLQGFLAGCLLLFGLFVWQRLRPLSRQMPERRRVIRKTTIADSTLLSLLRLRMTPKQAMVACVEEAKHQKFTGIVERATVDKLTPSVEGFNRVFCSKRERPKV
jgi:hypothetical protein